MEKGPLDDAMRIKWTKTVLFYKEKRKKFLKRNKNVWFKGQD